MDKNIFNARKGFIITVDAFLSVTLILLLVILSFFYLSSTSLDSWNVVDLKNIVFDCASVLEKSLALESAVKQSSSEGILLILNNTPNRYCFEVSVLDSTNLSPIITVLKAGCVKYSTEIISYERGLVVKTDMDTSFYLARVAGWVK
ncbi:MAG: hypothetical protein WC821_04115 [archaeon]|jgi:hypothetical protein